MRFVTEREMISMHLHKEYYIDSSHTLYWCRCSCYELSFHSQLEFEVACYRRVNTIVIRGILLSLAAVVRKGSQEHMTLRNESNHLCPRPFFRVRKARKQYELKVDGNNARQRPIYKFSVRVEYGGSILVSLDPRYIESSYVCCVLSGGAGQQSTFPSSPENRPLLTDLYPLSSYY